MSLMYDDVEELADVTPAQVPSRPSFNTDQWILNSPDISKLVDELIGHQSKTYDPEGKDYGTPAWSYNYVKKKGDAVKALHQLIESTTSVLAFHGDNKRKRYDHDVARRYAQDRVIRVLCNRIIALEQKQREPAAIVIRNRWLFRQARRSWRQTMATASTTVARRLTASQIADIRATRFKRKPNGAGAGVSAT